MIGMSSVSRPSHRSSVLAEEPTPSPTSAVGPTSSEERAPGSSRRGAERSAALVAYFAAPSPEASDLDAAWEEALTLYGDEDSDAWISALEEGTHPLCRVRMPKLSA